VLRRPARERRRLCRGCGCLLVVVVGAVVVALIAGAQALAAPDLGPAPGGRDDGNSQIAIAARLGTALGTELLTNPSGHGVVELSEHDLTVLVRQNNPDTGRFRNPSARVRDDLVVVDAQAPAGPFTVTAVARLALSRTTDTGDPRVTGTFRSVQVGNLGLPDAVAHALQDHVQRAFNLQDLLAANPILSAARSALECVRVGGGVVRMGFHRPDVAENAATCA
jgi:hypothetical protein